MKTIKSIVNFSWIACLSLTLTACSDTESKRVTRDAGSSGAGQTRPDVRNGEKAALPEGGAPVTPSQGEPVKTSNPKSEAAAKKIEATLDPQGKPTAQTEQVLDQYGFYGPLDLSESKMLEIHALVAECVDGGGNLCQVISDKVFGELNSLQRRQVTDAYLAWLDQEEDRINDFYSELVTDAYFDLYDAEDAIATSQGEFEAAELEYNEAANDSEDHDENRVKSAFERMQIAEQDFANANSTLDDIDAELTYLEGVWIYYSIMFEDHRQNIEARGGLL